ncbi:Rhomboid-like protein [Quillaja saponaria]|uniref:Rhomboid-like protein n=1 Tax=Quillaja saponaria TaxID=32244 RepID=A0AAD7VK09_QUISA|nr:Rhomboid-like protein [Quillaja saponaria]
MQSSLCRKVASHLSRKLSDNSYRLLHPHDYKTFSSLAKPFQTQIQDHIFSSFPSHPLYHSRPWRSQHNRFGKIRGFLSDPVLQKQSVLNSANTLLRVASKSFIDCRVKFQRAQFSGRSFGMSQNFDSYRRGWRSWFQRLTSSDIVLGLIVANVAVFLLWKIADRNFMLNNFTISLDNFKSGRLHTLITSSFSHIKAEHIISNMIGLYFFGNNIVRVFGAEYLLRLYLAGALGGSIFYLVHHAFLASKERRMWSMNPSKAPGLGASGAVNAIMLLDIFLFPKATLYLDFIIPVPAILLGIFLIGKDMLRIIEGDSHISGSAHLGGAAVAAIAWYRIRRGRF